MHQSHLQCDEREKKEGEDVMVKTAMNGFLTRSYQVVCVYCALLQQVITAFN